MRRALLGITFAVAFLGAAALIASQISIVQDILVRKTIEDRLAEQQEALFEQDALRVLFCGTSSPAPDLRRAKACVAVFAAGRFWLVDVGPGSWNTLGVAGVDGSRVGAVLLTHFHSDHIGDLGEVNLQTWTAGRPSKLQVYGPPGVERVVKGFSEAYALDSEYRVLHHSAHFMSPELGEMSAVVVPLPKYGQGPRIVIKEPSLRITAFPVRHDPVKPAYGYRFDYLGRSIVVSGDTEKSPALIEASKGTDVLIHDAMAKHIVRVIEQTAEELDRPRIAKLMTDIPSYHASAVQAARIANEAGARLLILYHLFPPPPNATAEQVYTRGVSEVRNDGWSLAQDGMLISLPEGTDEIVTEELPLR